MPKIPNKSTTSFQAVTEQMEQQEKSTKQHPHVVIIALAGTGKTTTEVEVLKLMVDGISDLSPSPQQETIWNVILDSLEDAKTFCMVAFNQEIAKVLQDRLPQNPNCSAMTLHSLGYKAIKSAYGFQDVDKDRSIDILAKLRKVSREELLAKSGTFAYEVSGLVSKCKINLIREPIERDLERLIEEYGVDIELTLNHTLAVNAVLQQSQIIDKVIDYDDMIWLPIINELSVTKYDLLFIDEMQDLSRAQQELAIRSGKRIVACGDPNQAIYAFAGADNQSFNRMAKRLSNKVCGSVELPLTVTYRCSQAVVKEAQKWVSDIVAHKANPVGSITQSHYELGDYNTSTYHDLVSDGDMVICRNNAPLVSQCLHFIKLGRKAYIRGRKDVAGSLVKLVKKIMQGVDRKDSIAEFKDRLAAWKNIETAKADAKKDDKLASYVKDRFECLMHFANWQPNVFALETAINRLFDDKETKGIMLSSIHQAKGLEARNVFFLMPNGAECPAPWAKTAAQAEQEKHLRYIGITRAIENLIYVS